MNQKIQTQTYDFVKSFFQEESTVKKVIDYFDRHEIIGEEIFPYIGQKYSDITERIEYRPVKKDIFLRRMPFYFYKPDLENHHVGNLSQYINGLIRGHFDSDFEAQLENLYCTLESMLYEYGIDVPTIFEFPINQSGYCSRTDLLYNWAHYLELAKQFGIEEKTPRHLFVEYNYLLERAGLKPVIYEIEEQFPGEYISRNGNTFSMQGTFPCDDNGKPILRWIGIKIKNATKIWVTVNERLKGTLYVEANSITSIWGLNCWGTNDDGSDAWYELYIAPQLMEFDYEALKSIRKREKLTQQQVADAIGAALRTYQKWESGATTPDCHYLLRLMNILDIREVKELTNLTDM